MKAYVFLFFVLSLFTACQNGDAESNEMEQFQILENAVVGFNDEGQISMDFEEGVSTFRYVYFAEENPDISDDEIIDEIYFQIDTSLSSFEYTDNELTELPTFFRRVCFCPPSGKSVSVGSISGERVSSNSWRVNINITYEVFGIEETKIVSGIFSPS